MAVLKNKTQGNFVIVSQNITKDRLLSLTERGLLLTLLSLPDGWNLSVAGLQKILTDDISKPLTGNPSTVKKIRTLGKLKIHMLYSSINMISLRRDFRFII